MTHTSCSINLTSNRKYSPGAILQLICWLIQWEDSTLIQALVSEQQALQPEGGDSYQRYSPCGNRVQGKKWEGRCMERDRGIAQTIVTSLVRSQVCASVGLWCFVTQEMNSVLKWCLKMTTQQHMHKQTRKLQHTCTHKLRNLISLLPVDGSLEPV